MIYFCAPCSLKGSCCSHQTSSLCYLGLLKCSLAMVCSSVAEGRVRETICHSHRTLSILLSHKLSACHLTTPMSLSSSFPPALHLCGSVCPLSLLWTCLNHLSLTCLIIVSFGDLFFFFSSQCHSIQAIHGGMFHYNLVKLLFRSCCDRCQKSPLAHLFTHCTACCFGWFVPGIECHPHLLLLLPAALLLHTHTGDQCLQISAQGHSHLTSCVSLSITMHTRRRSEQIPDVIQPHLSLLPLSSYMSCTMPSSATPDFLIPHSSLLNSLSCLLDNLCT